ncbi:MAG: proline iminopeptidase-family hydrolase [Saprospiraceae bacterium]|nr:proline iminopeptidase-family hydrolase [Saprospiraceae bacterium]
MKTGFILLLSALLWLSCQAPQTEKTPASPGLRDYFANTETGVQDGNVRMIPIQTPLGQYKVWTKRFGNNPRIKVLLLHGGPACTHEYFECFENFLPAEGIEFIYYDQLGSAYSDQPDDTSLWQLPRFVEELEQVRQALGLNKDNCYLLGHSWGGILAMEYAMKYQDNIKGLIISNMMSSCPAYGRYADEVLAKQLPPAVLDTIRRIEARGDFSNPKYMELLVPHFYTQHILRMPAEEWPEPVNRMFAHLNQQVYVTMQGPSEFGIGGNLAQWDRSAELHNIKIPTLVIGATHDTMDPKHMEWMAGQMPKGTFLLCPNGSHMDMWDDQQVYFQGLIKFLKTTDAAR